MSTIRQEDKQEQIKRIQRIEAYKREQLIERLNQKDQKYEQIKQFDLFCSNLQAGKKADNPGATEDQAASNHAAIRARAADGAYKERRGTASQSRYDARWTLKR